MAVSRDQRVRPMNRTEPKIGAAHQVGFHPDMDTRWRPHEAQEAPVKRFRPGLIGWLLIVLLPPAAPILAYRFVPPPATPLMVIRGAEGEGMRYDWVSANRISPALARAVIASEELPTASCDSIQIRQLLQNLISRIGEIAMTSAMQSQNARIVDRAKPPTSFIYPNVRYNVSLGAFAGIVLGFMVALVVAQLDDRVRSAADIAPCCRTQQITPPAPRRHRNYFVDRRVQPHERREREALGHVVGNGVNNLANNPITAVQRNKFPVQPRKARVYVVRAFGHVAALPT